MALGFMYLLIRSHILLVLLILLLLSSAYWILQIVYDSVAFFRFEFL